MGLGGGGVLLIYLTVFAKIPQLKAQGINLLFFLPVGLIAIIIYSTKHLIEWKIVLKMWIGGALGVGLGVLLTNLLETGLLSKIFAVFLIAFGSWQLLSKTENKSKQNSR
ncbi:MAG: TSUP family transporter [Clostridia bacterium]|nr:TSUP family transporter [Clostridia bacterium]